MKEKLWTHVGHAEVEVPVRHHMKMSREQLYILV